VAGLEKEKLKPEVERGGACESGPAETEVLSWQSIRWIARADGEDIEKRKGLEETRCPALGSGLLDARQAGI